MSAIDRTSRPCPARAVAVGGTLACALILSGCSVAQSPAETDQPAPARPTAGTDATPAPIPAPVAPGGEIQTIASDLDAPWSILRTPDDGVLISERDTGAIVEVLADGTTRIAGEVGGVDAYGEGGLLGIAHHRDEVGTDWLYAYYSGADDNRIVRMALDGTRGQYALGPAEEILTGIPRSANHNGGRIAFGPDGLLYATTGDAGEPDAAQDAQSLVGKILRMTPEGATPTENTSGSLVFSLGHRNPQGIAWDSHGRLWSAEFGQNTWDEVNLIEQGANYGWPVVEGAAAEPGFVDPLAQWPTSEASPSGMAIIDDTIFVASLRGERIWAVYPGTLSEAVDTASWFIGEFGRIRDVAVGADGTLWFLTNNTDGRGAPRSGDDHLLQVQLVPVNGQ